MIDPVSAIAGPLGIASSAVQGLVAVWQFLEIVQRIKDAPEDAKFFVRLIQQVQVDFQHAVDLRASILEILSRHYPLQSKWIRDVLVGAVDELNDFGRYVTTIDGSGRSPDLLDRVSYILKNQMVLKDRQSGLQLAHSRLLVVIGTMHSIAIPQIALLQTPVSAQPQQLPGFGGAVLSPKLHQSQSLRRRASRRPPGSDDEDEDEQPSTNHTGGLYIANSGTSSNSSM